MSQAPKFEVKTTILVLDTEEVNKTDVTICTKTISRRPYGELGSVDKGTCCGCCISLNTDFGPVSPGCGCDGVLVDEVVQELKIRMKTRGDTGQIQRAEEQLQKIANVEAKLDLLLTHFNINAPAAVSSSDYVPLGVPVNDYMKR